MRLLIYSDLHREHEPSFEPDERLWGMADVIVLAGDIDAGGRAVEWACSLSLRLQDRPIVMVAGNHEFYGGHFSNTLSKMREAARGTAVHILEDEAVVIEDVRFLGCSLWTDLQLGGANPLIAGAHVRQRMTDFRKITFDHRGGWRKLRPEDTVRRHEHSRAWLRTMLATPFDGPTVVVTHHAPSARSVNPYFADNIVSTAYASELDSLMGPAALWVHGHTHDSADYEINGTRVFSNPRGYPGMVNPEFRVAAFVDV